MESFAIKFLLLVVGVIVAEATRQIVDYIKRITPKVEYSVLSGIPINVEKKHYCAYKIKITNPSKKKVENVTLHVRVSNQAIKMEVISKPEGLEICTVEKDYGIDLTFPYLKHGEEVNLKAQVEGQYYFSDSLGVSVTSPNDIEANRVPYEKVKDSSISRVPYVVISVSVIISIILFVWIWKINTQPSQTETSLYAYEMYQRDYVISAASVVGLPHIAELYITASDPKYFNLGDLAYSYSVASKNPDEIMKYRKLISLTLGSVPGMLPESQASLYYSLGKLDLLVSDEKSALSDFRNAIVKNRTIVETKAKMDTKTNEFLIDKGLL